MTLVDLSSLFTVEGGFSPSLRGVVTAQYWVGNRPSVDVEGAEVRFSVPIRVPLEGVPVSIDMVPTAGVRCVRWTVEDSGNRRAVSRFTEIPDVALVGFGDLVQVDPATFEPTDEGQAAWDAAVTAAESARAGAVTARDAAVVSAEAAADAADAAVPAASQAVSAASTATVASGEAEAAQVAAEAAAASVAPGVPGGTATLDGAAKLPESQVPERLTDANLKATFEGVVTVYPSGDATGVTDLAHLEAAANAVTAGFARRVALAAGVFYINAPWKLPQRLTVWGALGQEHWYGYGHVYAYNVPGKAPGQPNPPSGLPFDGTVITQVTAGANVIVGAETATTLDLRNIVVTWATLNVNTGHGFVFEAEALAEGKPDSGAFGGFMEKLVSWGHDGDHYGFVFTNGLYNTTTHLRSYGGGGFKFRGDHAQLASGNGVHSNLYACIMNLGTANGYQFERMGNVEAGALTHNVFVRPQCNNGAGSGGTQLGWNDLGGPYAPTSTVVVGGDLEDNYANVVGPGTRFTEGSYVSSTKAGAQSRYGDAYWNCAYGARAMGAATSASFSTAFGARALEAVTTAAQNTAVGYKAGSVTTSAGNTFLGYLAGEANTTGTGGVAVGRGALKANLTNSNNTAVGYDCLTAATASSNTAVGFSAAAAMTTGGSNVAVGTQAAASATTGTGTTALGYQAGYGPAGVTANATIAGTHNTFVGSQTGMANATDSSDATAIGYRAVVSGNYALAVGRQASAGATGSVAIGTDSGGVGASTTTNNEIALGTANHTVSVTGKIKAAQRTPASATAPGVTGEICWDANYIYICTATNTWKRTAISTW